MKSFPFDSHVTYKSDGTPVFDRAVDSAVYRGLLKNLFTTGILSTDSTNMQVTSNQDMTVNVLSGFAMVEGVMNLNDETVTLEVEAADTNYARIDSVVLRLNTNDDFRNCDFYIVKGTPSESPVRPALTREIAVYELGLADIYVASGATSITADNITDTRYEEERCGVMTSGDISRYIDAIQSSIDEIVSNLTAEDDNKFKFGYEDNRYGYRAKDGSLVPFADNAVLDKYGKAIEIKKLVIQEILAWRNGVTLPYNFYTRHNGTNSQPGAAVVDKDGCVHIMSGDTSSSTEHHDTAHYKLEGDVWSSVSTLPYQREFSAAVVDKDGVIYGFSDDNISEYYAYTGASWSQLTGLPRPTYRAILDNEKCINIFGDGGHYRLKDGIWSSVSNTPYNFAYIGGNVALDENGNLNMMGGEGYGKSHYVYKDGAWSFVSRLPYSLCDGGAVSDKEGFIHILGGTYGGTYHYMFINGEWRNIDTIPSGFQSGKAVTDGKGVIHLLGGMATSNYKANSEYAPNGYEIKNVIT